MANYVILGSWKIRHDEYISPLEQSLYVVELSEGEAIGDKSVLYDLRALAGPVLDHPSGDPVDGVVLANLSADFLPLAIISTTTGDWLLTHLVHRVEVWVTHFLAHQGFPLHITRAELFPLLVAQFHQHYLNNNNFECYYEKGIPGTELEKKFNIKQSYNFYALNERFYAALADGEIAGFRPHLGDEIEHWSYDNDFFEIAPNEKRVAGFVSVMHWSRKKRVRFDEPVVTFKKKFIGKTRLNTGSITTISKVSTRPPERRFLTSLNYHSIRCRVGAECDWMLPANICQLAIYTYLILKTPESTMFMTQLVACNNVKLNT